MVDFVKEEQLSALNKSLEALQEQKKALIKALEVWDIAHSISGTVLGQVAIQKKKARNDSKIDRQNVANELESGLDELHLYLKGKVTAEMKKAYSQENSKLKNL